MGNDSLFIYIYIALSSYHKLRFFLHLRLNYLKEYRYIIIYIYE
ncbi:MAG: hypothetical protein ACKPKO_63015 [Candidatus Fonsibacter sp.]